MARRRRAAAGTGESPPEGLRSKQYTGAKITDEGIAQLRARIPLRGLGGATGGGGRAAAPGGMLPHCRVAHEDTIRHFVHAYGDDNPLWSDPEYAAKTRWGGIIAPPGYSAGGGPEPGSERSYTDQERALLRGDPLRGVHAFASGGRSEFWAPLRPGRTTFSRSQLVGVEMKKSEFANRAVHEWSASASRDDTGQLIGMNLGLFIRTERETAEKTGKYKDIVIEPYTDEQIREIDEQYAREKPRGAEPRYWEQVNEGDEIDPLVKGPLTLTDILVWHVGVGMGIYGVSSHRMAYKNRQRLRGFYIPNELHWPDVAQRCHWDSGYAQSIGNPYAYDYGAMRTRWLMHLCTDWMGDDGWLWKIDYETRRFNYLGDVHWMRGRITRKYLAEGERPAVDLDIQGENQSGEITCPGHATILLPSLEHGPVRLPDPPGGAKTLEELMQVLIRRYNGEE